MFFFHNKSSTTICSRRRSPVATALLLCLLASLAPAQGPTSLTQPLVATPPDLPGAPAPSPEIEGIDPPLSIYESCQMIGQAISLLANERAVTSDTLKQVDRMLYTIILYVDRVDRAHPTLPFYAWQGVSAEKTPREGWETQVFTLAAPIPQVTALSIRARHGDLEIRHLAAIDMNRTRWEFTQPIHVPADQPRPEICFLPLPTQLAEIRVTCRRTDPRARWPRLFIDAGISSIPESAKQARYYLQLSRNALKTRQLTEARLNLRQSLNLLRDYQKNRRF